MVCPICDKADCDDDCMELRAIYRERQREIYNDIAAEDEWLDPEPKLVEA